MPELLPTACHCHKRGLESTWYLISRCQLHVLKASRPKKAVSFQCLYTIYFPHARLPATCNSVEISSTTAMDIPLFNSSTRPSPKSPNGLFHRRLHRVNAAINRQIWRFRRNTTRTSPCNSLPRVVQPIEDSYDPEPTTSSALSSASLSPSSLSPSPSPPLGPRLTPPPAYSTLSPPANTIQASPDPIPPTQPCQPKIPPQRETQTPRLLTPVARASKVLRRQNKPVW